ncbi:uncharacterized protein V6R79_006024 [Siganus canaliculatus]
MGLLGLPSDFTTLHLARNKLQVREEESQKRVLESARVEIFRFQSARSEPSA